MTWTTPLIEEVPKIVKLKISGETILIDAGDEKEVKKYDWWYSARPGVQTTSYGSRKTTILLHRFLSSCSAGMVVDHINGDNRDNRRSNLRLATKSQNAHNRRKLTDSSSHFKGVSWYESRKRWVAEIKISNERKHLGYFISEVEAAKAYNQAARKYHKEFAVLNEINGEII